MYVYEAVVEKKRKGNLLYIDGFGLGYFSTLEKALDAITTAKKLSGFCDLSDECFSVKPRLIDEGFDRKEDIKILEEIYIPWYDYMTEDGHTIGNYFGAFSRLEYAEEMLRRYEKWELFETLGLKHFGITKVEI